VDGGVPVEWFAQLCYAPDQLMRAALATALN